VQSPDVDAVLLIHAPTAFADAAGIAAAVCDAAEGAERSVFTCWVGGDAVRDARRVASSRGLPSYDAPERAIEVFLGIVQYGRNRELLMQTPPSVPAGFAPDSAKARRLVAGAALWTRPAAGRRGQGAARRLRPSRARVARVANPGSGRPGCRRTGLSSLLKISWSRTAALCASAGSSAIWVGSPGAQAARSLRPVCASARAALGARFQRAEDGAALGP
jgi:hypothetical protein